LERRLRRRRASAPLLLLLMCASTRAVGAPPSSGAEAVPFFTRGRSLTAAAVGGVFFARGGVL
jgi:hypothetical protein